MARSDHVKPKLSLISWIDIPRCRSTPARHAANPYRKESHPMLRRNTNIDWTLKITLLCILTIVQNYGYVYIRIFNNAHKYGYVFIRNQTDPDKDGATTEQTSIHRVLLIKKVLYLY